MYVLKKKKNKEERRKEKDAHLQESTEQIKQKQLHL